VDGHSGYLIDRGDIYCRKGKVNIIEEHKHKQINKRVQQFIQKLFYARQTVRVQAMIHLFSCSCNYCILYESRILIVYKSTTLSSCDHHDKRYIAHQN
jgi:hypothetical protein